MSQQSEMADVVRRRLDAGPISVASLVTELRIRWGSEHSPAEVHFFVSEVVHSLLWGGEVRLGEMQDGVFVSWAIEPWDAVERLEKELGALDGFLEDNGCYVLSRAVS